MIEGIPAIAGFGLEPIAAPQGVGQGDGLDAGFGDQIFDAVDGVDDAQHAADDALYLLASGEEVDLHGTMIALEEADIALRTMVSVRDKLISAYEQVMNMTI